MGHSARQLAERFHLLGLPQLFLTLAQCLLCPLALGDLFFQFPVGGCKFCGVMFQAFVQALDLSHLLGVVPHLAHVPMDCKAEKNVFKEDPAHVLEPAPVAERKNAID